MNQKTNLVSSDYCLIYTCVVKFQSVLLDRRRTRSIHCLYPNDSIESNHRTKSKNKLISSSLLNKSFDCSCGAIHFSSGLNEEASLKKYRDISRLTNQQKFSRSNQKLNHKSFASNSLSQPLESSIEFLPNCSLSSNETVSNQRKLVDSSKTASTSAINSKLKSPGRLSSASGHRMPNSNLKNASNSSSTQLNESATQQCVGGNQQQTSTNQIKAKPTRITDQDAIQLLAEDVESRLEALLRTFIQEEKLRQEARYNSLMGKRSASLSALNSEYNDLNEEEKFNTDYSPMSRSLYSQQLNSNKHPNNLATNKTNLGYVKPQQHRMQQSYQLHNSKNVNTLQQQKPTAIKTSSHRLDTSPSRSNVQNSKVVGSSKTRSPSPTGRSTTPTQSNVISVNRNNLFGQHTCTDQSSSSNKTSSSSSSNNKPVTTNYLNLHQRSHSPSKDAQHQQALKNNQSSHLGKQHQMSSNNLMNSQNQFVGHSSHRLYSPSPNHKFYDPFAGNSMQFGRSKDDSHIRRVVVYNLNKEAVSAEKKPVVIEGSKRMNGTLNSNFNTTTAAEKNGTNLNDNQAIRLSRSAKTRANSPSRGGMMNGANIGPQSIQQPTNTSTANRIIANSSANTAEKSTSSGNNSSSIVAKKLSSTTGNKVITSKTSNRLTTGHEISALQLKDQNNIDYSTVNNPNVGGSSSAAQLNTERKVVRKVIVKELDGPSARIESAVNSNLSKKSTTTYQQKQQRLSPILNGDLNSTPKMATLNTQQPVSTTSNLNNQLQSISSFDALLSERDRILNNRDQYKNLRNNVLSSNSDANNNYISLKNNQNETTSSTKNSSAAGLLINQSATNRNLPLSSPSNPASSKRKPLVDRYSPFSIVNEARQRWEENVIKKNGMNGQLPSRFNLECLDDHSLSDLNDDLIFNETFEKSGEVIVDSSMVLIRSRLSSMLSANGNVSNLPNSAIISLLEHLSNSNKKIEPETMPSPACLSEFHKNDLNTSYGHCCDNDCPSLKLPLDSLNLASSNSAINSMRPPLVLTTNPPSDLNDYSTSTGNQSNSQYSASQHRANSVRPFLSKGSVAERVMLFEKHPQLKQIEETEAANRKEESAITQRVYKTPSPYSNWREKNKNEVINLSTSFEQNLRGKPPLSRQQNLSDSIPKFYYPHGKPSSNNQQIDQLTKQVNQFFKTLKDGICTKDKLIDLCKASNFPIYWKEPLFLLLAQNNQITHDSYLTFWRRLIGNYFDEASKFVFILSKGKRNCLLPEDFIAMIQDVIDSHPGLLFLKFATEFHSRYVHTVIARIYYSVNRSWSNRISINELRKSNFLQIVKLLQEEDDINQITDYFSYEHFYVIYCRFWSLDKDHDLVIDKYDLSRHNDGAISSRMIERIFSGAVTQSKSKSKQMTYQEFVFFLISEEDKKTETAIEYWFRCLDLDGDGYISLYELEYFYEEQVRRMESIGVEALPFSDTMCQMLDMINPEQSNKISLSDLKKCSMTYIFLDTFFNLHKYLLHEQKDPFSNKDDQLQSDWDKFAAEEYAILVQEEQNQMLVDENENESENYDQTKYTTFVYDEPENEFQVNQYPHYDEYESTDQEDYLDDESLY